MESLLEVLQSSIEEYEEAELPKSSKLLAFYLRNKVCDYLEKALKDCAERMHDKKIYECLDEIWERLAR